MLKLQSSPVLAIIFLIINFIFFTLSAPISEEFQEIDLPTDEITENDLSRLSDSDLLSLERALQQKIEEFENEKNGFVEDFVPIPNNFDERRLINSMGARVRRAGGRRSSRTVPVINENGAVELFPIPLNGGDEQQPIVVIEEPAMSENDEIQFDGVGNVGDGDDRQFVLIPESEDELAEAEGLIPIEIIQDALQSKQESQPIMLSENDIDELELRQRLADLGEQLTKRSIQGF
jgi:hypothetical protein